MRVLSGFHRRTNRWFVLGLLAAAAPGCAGNPFGFQDAQPAAPAVAAAAADPVAAFAATAVPGSEAVAALPESGGNARLRLLRSYNAASGRECREVLIGTGLAERSRLLCRHEEGWAAARPLLSGGGGGGARP